MVRLLLEHGHGDDAQQRSFNPTMVRLLLLSSDNKDINVSSFNPTMVRLLPAPHTLLPIAAQKFQSHNGAIAAVRKITTR